MILLRQAKSQLVSDVFVYRRRFELRGALARLADVWSSLKQEKLRQSSTYSNKSGAAEMGWHTTAKDNGQEFWGRNACTENPGKYIIADALCPFDGWRGFSYVLLSCKE